MNIVGGIIGKEIDPLSKNVISYIMSQTRESVFLDFKKIINLTKDSDFPKIVKDVLAFANAGGGFIPIGFQENDGSNSTIKRKYVPVGIPDGFTVDQASLQEKINSFLNIPLQIGYVEFQHSVKLNRKDFFTGRFAVIYIPPGPDIIMPVKNGEYKFEDKKKNLFNIGEIIVRRGTQNVIASSYEINWIKQRSKDTSYMISVLSGKPDDVEEMLYSNIFEVTQIPKYVWYGTAKYQESAQMKNVLREKNPSKNHTVLGSRYWNGKIIALQDLSNPNNEYHYLVETDVAKEPLSNWLASPDKKRIIVELLNNEIRSFAVNKGLFIDYKRKKLFFPSDMDSRTEEWPARFKVSKKMVVGKVYSAKLNRFIFWHVAVDISVATIGDKFYLSIYPTFGVSEDGKHLLEGIQQGSIITSLQYNKFNDQYLNNLLFWIKKLSDGQDEIKILTQLTISAEPVSTTIEKGIRWDIPPSELKHFIENYKPELEEELDDEHDEIEGAGTDEF